MNAEVPVLAGGLRKWVSKRVGASPPTVPSKSGMVAEGVVLGTMAGTAGVTGPLNVLPMVVEGLRGIVLLKRRIATCVAEKIAEHAIMENAKGTPDRGLAVAPGIP